MVGVIVDTSWQDVALGLVTDHSYLLMLVPRSKAPMSASMKRKIWESQPAGAVTVVNGRVFRPPAHLMCAAVHEILGDSNRLPKL